MKLLFAAGQSEVNVNELYHQELLATADENIATTTAAINATNPWDDAEDAFDGDDETVYYTASYYDSGSYSALSDWWGQQWASNISDKIVAVSLRVKSATNATIGFTPQTYNGSTWSDYETEFTVNNSTDKQFIEFATPVTGVQGLRFKCTSINGSGATNYGIYDVEYHKLLPKEITVGWPTTTYDWMLEIKRLDADEDWRTINTTLGLNKSQAYNLTDTATTLTDALTRSGNTITIPASLLKIGAEYIVKVYRVARGHFDIQLYSGTGANRTVSHDLGVAPCAFRLKAYDKDWPPWCDYHKTVPATHHLRVNQTNGAQTGDTVFNNTAPTSTQITLGSAAFVNQSGANFCLYLWGASGIYDVKRYTTTSTPHTIDLDWHVQSAQFKNISVSSDWVCLDTARDTSNPADEVINYNTDDAETTGVSMINFTSSGIEILSTAVNPIFSTGNDIDVFFIRRPEE